MNTATRCAYTARHTRSGARLSPSAPRDTDGNQGGAARESASRGDGLPKRLATLGPDVSYAPQAATYSNPGDVALIRSPAGCRADRMMGSGAHLSGVSSLP